MLYLNRASPESWIIIDIDCHMLSENGARHSEVTQVKLKGAINFFDHFICKAVLEIISKSVEPQHEELNGLLKELSSDPIFYELNSSPEFSMEAVLDSVNN